MLNGLMSISTKKSSNLVVFKQKYIGQSQYETILNQKGFDYSPWGKTIDRPIVKFSCGWFLENEIVLFEAFGNLVLCNLEDGL